jgi:hypothetical protein
MKEKDPKRLRQSSGNQPPPRPPKSTAIASGPDDDDNDPRKKPKKETVRINLPPKSSDAPTIRLPTLPPAGPFGQSTVAGLKLTNAESAPALPPTPGRRILAGVGNTELGMILAAVIFLNGTLYILCRL